MKIFKILVWVSLVLVVIVVGGIFAITNLVNPNDYKPQISEAVKKNTGRDLRMDGDLKLTFFPWLSVETGALSLSNAPGFEDGPMVDIGNAHISMKIMPLLSRQVEIDTVLLESPRVRLTTQADGRTNWDDLVTSLSGQPSEDSELVDEGAMAIAGLVIEGISIDGGEVSWQDHQLGEDFKLESINLITGRLVPGEPLDIEFSVNGSGSMLPEPGTVSLDTTLTLGENMKSLGLDETALVVSSDTANADMNIGKVLLAIDSGLVAVSQVTAQLNQGGESVSANLPSINYDPSTESLELPDLTLVQGENKVKLSVSASKILSQPAANGRFEVQTGDIEALLTQISIESPMPELELGALETSVEFSFENNIAVLDDLSLDATINQVVSKLVATRLSFNLDSGDMKVESATVEQEDFSLEFSGSGANLIGESDSMQVSGSVAAAVSNLKNVLDRNQLLIELPPGLGQDITTSLDFNLAGGNVDIRALDIKAGDMTISGVASMGLDKPKYRFNLDINSLNLDRLLGTEDSEGKSVEESEEGATTGTAEQLLLPVAALQGLILEGQARIGEVITTGLVLSNVDATVNSDGNIVKLDPLNAEVAGGAVRVGLHYDVSGDVPAITFTNQTQNLNVGELLEALEITEKVDGMGSLDVNLSGSGVDIDGMIASLSGDMQFRLNDGALRGFDLQATLLKLQENLAKYKGKELTETQKPEAQTRFTELTGSFDVSQGVFVNHDLSMKAPAFRVDGAGRVDLPSSALDYRLNINVVETVEGQGGESLSNLKGTNIPLRIRGPLESPGFALDVTRLLQDQVKKELNKVITKELGLESEDNDEDPSAVKKEPEEEIKDKLKKDLTKGLLKSLGFD
jgi:AsmA protein